MAVAYKPTSQDDKARADKERTDKALHKERSDRPEGPQTGVPQNAQRDDKRDDRRDARSDDRRERIDNRDQDPNHPANNTPAYRGDPAPRPVAEGVTVPPEEMLTEQEKAAKEGGAGSDGNLPGVGPHPGSAETTGPVETIEDQGIGPRTPYPTGDPPPPSEFTKFGQGVKGRTDQVQAKPGSSSGPAGQAPELGDRDAAYEANRKSKEPHK